MKAGRWLGVMVLLLGLGLGIVHLRAEQSRCAVRILSSEIERLHLRSELWALQTSAARLKSPMAVRDRLVRLEALATMRQAPGSGDTKAGITLTSR